MNDLNKIKKDINNNNRMSLSNENLILLKTDHKKNLWDFDDFEENSDDTKNSNKIDVDLINKNNSFLLIDSDHIFKKISPDYINEINSKLKIKYQNKDTANKLRKLSNSINMNLLEYLYPNTIADFFSISKEISKIIKKTDLLKKDKLENNISYFFSQRVFFKYTKTLMININFIHNCGPLLCYIYTHFDDYKIKDGNSFRKSIIEAKKQQYNILKELYLYCNDKALRPENVNKLSFFKGLRKKYILQPELILILNMLHLVIKINIDFDFSRKEINNNEFHLFILIILNIKYLINDFKDIKINFANRNIQYGKYGVNNYRLEEEFNYNIIYKMNIKSFNKNIYNEKWNFENNFNLELYRASESKKSLDSNDNDTYLTDYIQIDLNDINFNSTENCINYMKSCSKDNIEKKNDNKGLKKRSLTFLNNSNKNKINENKVNSFQEYFIDFIKKHSNIFEMIFVTFFSLDILQNLDTIELILNESYYDEISEHFKESCQINIGGCHLLDFIYYKLIKMKSLNFEINSFDLLTFNRILKILYNNNNLINLKFSFFSSDSTYLPEPIYNIYKENRENKLMKCIKITKMNQIGLKVKIDEKFFKDIYTYFIRNLNYFFEILKYKNLESIGLNFDIPSPILKDENYIIAIIKFIINILILYYCNSEYKIQELIILSPMLIINGNKYLFFDRFLNDINNSDNYAKIINLSIQMKFFNIKSIHKLINKNIKILNLGDFDLFTLNNFLEEINKQSFTENSSLEKLTINLNKLLIDLNDDIKLSMAKLFNIKIKDLSIINLYTNIDVKNIDEFKQILDLIKDNWIPSYLILFNSKSYNIINNNLKITKNIEYITENQPKTKNNANIDDNEKILVKREDAFKFLNKAFDSRSYLRSLDFYNRKAIIANIFKYLYVCKKIIINFNIPKDKNIQL